MAISCVKKGLTLVLPLALLAGCASTPRLGGDPNLKVYPSHELPAPDSSDLTAQARPYYVGPFDKISVDVFGVAELSGREVQVDEKGNISFPPAGIVEVGGKTPREIEQVLANRLRASHVRDPQVTVGLKQAVSQVVTIEGEVKGPGLYPVFGHMTLLRLMALANGTTDIAKLQDIVIFRTVRDQRYAAIFDLKSISHGGQPDPEVYANDIVVVGASPTRKFIKDLLAITPALTSPLLIYNNVTR